MIQEELVREAILAVCFSLFEKHRKGEKIKEAIVQSQCGQLQIQLPSVQRRKQSAQEQLIANLWLVEKGTGPLSQSWWLYLNLKTCLQCNELIHLIQRWWKEQRPWHQQKRNILIAPMTCRLEELPHGHHTKQLKRLDSVHQAFPEWDQSLPCVSTVSPY